MFLVGALGTGLLVSTIAETQQVAFQAAMLLAFLPTFMLSGFIFPIASMPVALQYITTVVPARYFLIALRGVVLKGLGPARRCGRRSPRSSVYAVVVLGLSAVRLATPMMRRIRTLIVEGVPGAAADAAALRPRHRSRRSSS